MPKDAKSDINKSIAIKFVVLFGVISFFADITYEGARSITGPFLEMLNANATIVGFVAGFGELIGYALRLVSGFWIDRTHRYWTIAFIGYFVNLFAVPLLAFAGNWQWAAFLIVMERAGKAIRVPARDTMLSHASQRMGMGWGFGLHEAFDKAGAMLGPIIIAVMLFFHSNYRHAFAMLFIPAIIAIIILLIDAFLYPHPQHLEIKRPELETKGLTSLFWLYLIGSCLVAAGYADFPLIAYHFEKINLMPNAWIPISYALGMAVSAITSLLFGKLYDRYGFSMLIVTTFLGAFFAPLVFLGGFYFALLGMMLWGLGMGGQTSLMKAVVANMVSTKKRGSAYGIFNTGYGIFWFLGSVLIGRLYDSSIITVVIFSLLAQLAAIPVFIAIAKKIK